jgi:hypothetical protein
MLALNCSLLGFAYSVLLTILGLTLNAQTPATPHPVPLKDEPHFPLIFENTYVRVFRVNLLGHTTTLTHKRDLPYVYVAIGPADFIDAVADKPEVHKAMTDGQVGYSQGGIAHVIRTEAGLEISGNRTLIGHCRGSDARARKHALDAGAHTESMPRR